MKKIIEGLKSETFKLKVKPEIKRFLAVIIFTLIYGLGLVWFLEESAIPMYTGGMPGLGQVLRDLFVYNLGWMREDQGNLFMSLFVIVANIPILLLGWFGVSKKFTIYSLISILVQSLVIGFIPKLNLGLNEPAHALIASVLGGLLIGVGVGGALKYGTSTGGVDIIAQYYSLKKGKSVGFVSMILNVVIALAGALTTGGRTINGVLVVPGLVFSYTIIRIIITTVSTDKIHTGYQHMAVNIITEAPRDVINDILIKLHRGVTLTKVQGAYSQHERIMIYVVISSYEFQSLLDIVRIIDNKAFITTTPVKGVYGNFKKKTIA